MDLPPIEQLPPSESESESMGLPKSMWRFFQISFLLPAAEYIKMHFGQKRFRDETSLSFLPKPIPKQSIEQHSAKIANLQWTRAREMAPWIGSPWIRTFHLLPLPGGPFPHNLYARAA